MIRVMLIEDDEEIIGLLERYLKEFNLEVFGFTTPNSALNSLQMDHYDIIILDLTLPQMDGLELCKIITSKHNIPIIISTARGSLSDKVTGLEMGADDYLPKPYDPRELVARIHSVLRRNKLHLEFEQSSEFELDEKSMTIHKNEKKLDLTMAEYEILRLLVLKKGSVISREYIANNVDAIRWDSSDRSIDVIIARIRNKIGDDVKNPKYIKTIRGAGYKLL